MDISAEAFLLETESTLVKPIMASHVVEKERFGRCLRGMLLFKISPQSFELVGVFPRQYAKRSGQAMPEIATRTRGFACVRSGAGRQLRVLTIGTQPGIRHGYFFVPLLLRYPAHLRPPSVQA